MLIGGSACPRFMIEIFENKYDVEVVHAWGMTEMSPLGTLGTLKHASRDLPYEEARLQDANRAIRRSASR